MNGGEGSTGRWLGWTAFAIVLAGAALRIAGLTGWDMWTDEVQSLWMAESGEFWFGPMYRTAPINFWLTGWAVDLLGANEGGLRAVPAFTGILTVGVLFLAVRSWLSDRIALLATAVLAFSFWHVAWSQTGRHFALQTLLVLGALHGFFLYWNDGRRIGLGVTAGFLLVALFTHSSSGFYVVALLLVLIVVAARKVRAAGDLGSGLRSLWPRPAAAGLALLGVLLLYLPIYFGVGAYVLETRSAWNPPWNILGSLGFYVTPVVGGFAAGGAFYLWGRHRNVALVLVSVAVTPAVLLVAASGITIASAAYCLPSMLAVAVLAGAGCEGVLRATAHRRPLFLAGCFVVAALFFSQGEDLVEYHLFQNGLKPRWTEATDYVREHREPGERVWAAEGDVARYYLGSDRVQWLDERSEADEPADGEEAGEWFILYLQSRPDLGAMMEPTLEVAELPRGARFEALFPLRYGPKDRTLVVLRRDGDRSTEAGMEDHP